MTVTFQSPRSLRALCVLLFNRIGWAAVAVSFLAVAGCKPAPREAAPAASGSPAESASGSPAESITNYDARGVVLSLKPEDKSLVVRHEEIPGYMMAMTMPFEVRDTNELKGIQKGDGIQFRLRVTERDGWIDQLKVISNASPAVVTTNTPEPAFRVLPNVPDLHPGDLVPNYTLTNQFGKRFALSDFRGQALAVTFIFTRCPFPLFCPRMSDHFGQVQRLMQADKAGPTNWHLLSVSFDPGYDTAETMKSYGERWKADAPRWTLATGSMDQIEPFAISVGLYFGRDVAVANLNHNLRTLVIGPDGRLQQVLVGNEWTSAELTSALVKAAQSR